MNVNIFLTGMLCLVLTASVILCFVVFGKLAKKQKNVEDDEHVQRNKEAKRQFQKEAEMMKQDRIYGNSIEKREQIKNDEQAQHDKEAAKQILEFLQHEDQEKRDRERAELQERIARERAEKEEAERMRQLKRIQSIAYLNANKEKLILKYSTAVENFIDRLTMLYSGVFVNLFNDTEVPWSSTLVKPHEN